MPQRNVEKTPSDCISMCKYWANGCESADHAMQAHGDAGVTSLSNTSIGGCFHDFCIVSWKSEAAAEVHRSLL